MQCGSPSWRQHLIESGQLTSLALEFKTRREGPMALRQLYAHSLESRFISPIAAVSGVAPGPRPNRARLFRE